MEFGVDRLMFEAAFRKLGDSPQFSKAVFNLYLHVTRRGCGSFLTHLWDAIFIADYFNRNRLRMGFPHEVCAWEAWHFSEDEESFFRSWNIPVGS